MNRGKVLAKKLKPSIGSSAEIDDICVDICRLAKRHHRLAEIACNRSLTEGEENEDTGIETKIRTLVAKLPLVDGKQIKPRFQGDPRGATVALVMPDGRYDSFGGKECGLVVPTEDE